MTKQMFFHHRRCSFYDWFVHSNYYDIMRFISICVVVACVVVVAAFWVVVIALDTDYRCTTTKLLLYVAHTYSNSIIEKVDTVPTSSWRMYCVYDVSTVFVRLIDGTTFQSIAFVQMFLCCMP